MPLDVFPLTGSSNPHLPASLPSLNQAERDAAVHFAQMLRAQLASQPPTSNAMVLLAKMMADLKDTSVRLVRSEDAREIVSPNEVALAWVLQGVPESAANRLALALRLASAAAVLWRQHCQIQRLGFLNA
jgi:hypothetical protein